MKQLRLVFKGHLLPPLVLPFQNIRQFMQVTHPIEYEEAKLMSEFSRKEKLNGYQEEMLQMNEMLMQQVNNFREKYVLPLKKCPSYFDILDKQASANFSSLIKGQYIVNISKIPAKTRLACFKTYKLMYSQFKAELKKSNINILDEVPRIPIFLYNSAVDMAQIDKKSWQNLTSKEKNDYELTYLKTLAKYNDEILKLSMQSSLSKAELFQCLGNPLEYYEDTSLRSVLLA